jgi:hypothetical protein
MKTGNLILVGVTAIAVSSSAAIAQQQGSLGMITGINRLNGTLSIQPLQGGTVGSSATTTGPVEQFKVKDGAMLDTVHAGDRVTYSLSDNGGGKTIGKLEKQK